MTIKAYDGTTWQTQKSLKIYDGTSWIPAKKAWVFNGTNWFISYPESPQNVSGASISALSGISGRIGCVYIASIGSWNSTDAYIPTSYTYQWTRSGVDISGATNNTYATGADDVEKIIGCRVTATNLRGSTPSSATTGLTMLTQVTSLTGTNTTQAVSIPTVSFNPNGLSYSGSWNSILNATTYETTSGGTAGSPSVNIAGRSFSGTGTAGSASFSVRAVNTNRVISLSWPAAIGASSYDLYINGTMYVNVGNVTSYSYNPPDDSARNFTIYPRSTTIQGYGASVVSPVAAAARYSDYGTGSANLVQPNATSPTYASGSASTSNLSVSWGGATNATKYRVYWIANASWGGDSNSTYDAPEWTGTSASYSGSYSEGNTYYFYIAASGDNNVWTPYGSYKASGSVPYTAPGAPAPSVSGISSSGFTISWAAVPGASSYNVMVGTYYGGGNIVNSAGNGGTSYVVSGLSASTTYYVTVSAFKSGYNAYGPDGTTSANTTASPAYSIGTPTRPTFYRSGTTIKWGMDNPSFSGAFEPYGIEWEVGNNASSANISSGNTKTYNTNYISSSGLSSIWHYIVGTHAGDIPATSSPRYLRFRLYGYNPVTFTFVDGPWSAWSL
jgi:hypothetical protein